jgi:hypothetical protein
LFLDTDTEPNPRHPHPSRLPGGEGLFDTGS